MNRVEDGSYFVFKVFIRFSFMVKNGFLLDELLERSFEF